MIYDARNDDPHPEGEDTKLKRMLRLRTEIKANLPEPDEVFVRAPLNHLSNILDLLYAEKGSRIGTHMATGLPLSTLLQRQMNALSHTRSPDNYRAFSGTFNRNRFARLERKRNPTGQRSSVAEETVDDLRKVDTTLDALLTEEVTSQAMSDLLQRTPSQGKNILFFSRDQIDTDKFERNEDARVQSEYGCYNLEYTQDQFEQIDALFRSQESGELTRDISHIVTVLCMQELLSRKIIVRNKVLSELYEGRVEDESLPTSSKLDASTGGRSANEKTKEYRQWRQSGAMYLPLKNLTVNVGNLGEVQQISVLLPKEDMLRFYRGDKEATAHIYQSIKSDISAAMQNPQRSSLKKVTAEVISNAFHPDETKDLPFRRADVQVNFTRNYAVRDLARAVEINNLTGKPQDATPHVYTVVLDSTDHTPVKLQVRTHHPDNDGKVQELLIGQSFPEFAVLAQVAAARLDKAPSHIAYDEYDKKVEVSLGEDSGDRFRRILKANEALPTFISTTEMHKDIVEATKRRAIALNEKLQEKIFRRIELTGQYANDRLIDVDSLATMAVGLFANLSGEKNKECYHMDILIETPNGEFSPCILPVPLAMPDFLQSYTVGLQDPQSFHASAQRGEKLALAFGLFTQDKHFALDPVVPASTAARLGLAAGGMKSYLQTVSEYTDNRSRFIRNGSGGLSSTLGKVEKFTPATTDYYVNQPSMTICKNGAGNKQFSFEIDKERRKVVQRLAENSGRILQNMMECILKDLEAYAQQSQQALHRPTRRV